MQFMLVLQFLQNPEIRSELLATEGSTLVEAAPRDCRWGIGLGMDNPKALSRDTWRGKNWLGQVLTEVRDEIQLMTSQDDASTSATGACGSSTS